MALDPVPTYPGNYDANEANNTPSGSDTRREGDDQIRRIKASEKSTWTNVTGAVTASHEEINRLTGISLTDPIITLPSGTIMLFEAPAAAPTGWLKKTDAAYDDVAIRISTGTLTQGGTHAFSTLFADLAEAASPGIGLHQIVLSEMASHSHGGGAHSHLVGDRTGVGGAQNIIDYTPGQQQTGATNVNILTSGTIIGTEGGNGSHSHTMDNKLKYRDTYFAEKS